MQEEWRPIAGYEGYYEVSNLGRVRSIDRKDARGHNWNGKILKQGHTKKDGYLQVRLTKNGKHRSFRVHRLVATAFVPNPNNLTEVSHLDESRDNNAAYNLVWADHISNCAMPKFRERRSNASKNGKNNKARAVICDGVEYECIKDCAQQYDVPVGSMNQWLVGRRGAPQKFIDMGLSYVGEECNLKPMSRMYKLPVICEGVVYTSVSDCAKRYGTNYYTLSHALQNNKLTDVWIERGLKYFNVEDFEK